MKLHFEKNFVYNLIFAFGLLFAICSINRTPGSLTVSSPNISGLCIVLDAGHGSPDGGAVGVGGTFEKDINLSITKKLGNLLQQSGVNVVYTRENDKSIAYDEKITIAQIKRADMKRRVEIRDGSNADMFISIHMNKYFDATQSGAQVFYTDINKENKGLAESIQKNLRNSLNPQNRRLAKNSGKSIYVLNNANIPGVLVECGFLSNPTEEKLLITEDYQNKVAFAIYSGIIEYIN